MAPPALSTVCVIRFPASGINARLYPIHVVMRSRWWDSKDVKHPPDSKGCLWVTLIGLERNAEETFQKQKVRFPSRPLR